MTAVPQRVDIAWTTGDAHALALRVATSALGRHPGPLHHGCPTCGSIEHGRPSFDAPVWVSIAHGDGLHLVAVSPDGPVGVDLEAAADRSWIADEAVGKLRGTGIVHGAPDRRDVTLVDLDVPGHLAVLAVSGTGAPEVRVVPATA